MQVKQVNVQNKEEKVVILGKVSNLTLGRSGIVHELLRVRSLITD